MSSADNSQSPSQRAFVNISSAPVTPSPPNSFTTNHMLGSTSSTNYNHSRPMSVPEIPQLAASSSHPLQQQHSLNSSGLATGNLNAFSSIIPSEGEHSSSSPGNLKYKRQPSESIEGVNSGMSNQYALRAKQNQFFNSEEDQSDGKKSREEQKKELKAKKQHYQREKKARLRIITTFGDDNDNLHTGWLKMRRTLHNWTKYYFILRPGVLLYYRDDKHREWSGTVLLNGCEVIERPTKKEGFCFKVYHPLDYSIFAPRGPKGEVAVVFPLSADNCILRCGDEAEGKVWMNNIEKARKLHLSSASDKDDRYDDDENDDNLVDASMEIGEPKLCNESQLSQSPNLAVPVSMNQRPMLSDNEEDDDDEVDEVTKETQYVSETPKEIHIAGEVSETWGEESKSLMWTLLKQVRPGMDLSKVVLPTFILEPRSFLDKLSDYYFHSDILASASKNPDPLERILGITKWYMSGFYAAPKGVKKPYNPIIGETFRCLWKHPTNSNTFFIAEQVSHHPPISAWYACNRMEGFCINGSLVTKSKFYGNSAASILEGIASLHFLNFGEEYTLTFPTFQVKGLLMGALTMEMTNSITIQCDQTGYKSEVEFKLKPMFGGEYNCLKGKVKDGQDNVVRTFSGKWDSVMEIADPSTGRTSKFWEVNASVRDARLPRQVVAFDEQGPFESEKLWKKVTLAIGSEDQVAATEEKAVLEGNQRLVHKELKEHNKQWEPKFFRKNADGQWVYKYINKKKWNQTVDFREYESEGVIQTQTVVSGAANPLRSRNQRNRNSIMLTNNFPVVIEAADLHSASSSLPNTLMSHSNSSPLISGTATSDISSDLSHSGSIVTSTATVAPVLSGKGSKSDMQLQQSQQQQQQQALGMNIASGKGELQGWINHTNSRFINLTKQVESLELLTQQQQHVISQLQAANRKSNELAMQRQKQQSTSHALLVNVVLIILLILIQVFIQFRGK